MTKLLFDIFKKDQQSIKLIKMSKFKRFLLYSLCAIAIIALFSMMLFPLVSESDEIKKMIPFVNPGYVSIVIGFYLTFVFAFVSSAGFLFSSGYLDKNLDNYITLPINRRKFVIAKLAISYISTLQLVALVSIPFIIAYIIYAPITLSVLLAITLYILTMPLIVLYIVSFIVSTLLAIVNNFKNKALAKIILYVSVFGILFSVYLVVVIGSSSGHSTEMIITLINFIQKSNSIFFYQDFALDLLNNANYINILYMLLALSTGILFILYFEKLYFKGAIGFNESGKLRKTKKNKKESIKTRAMFTWFFIREAKELFNTGAYFVNTLLGNIMIVVIYLGMLGYMYFFQLSASDLNEFSNFITKYTTLEYVILITLAVGTFFTFFNLGSASSFSRDAKVIDFINTLPINYGKSFLGKVFFHALVEFLTLFVFLGTLMIILKINIIYIFISVLIMLLLSFSTIFISICVDLNFPTLDWESETALVKRGKSIIISMISHVILIAIVFLLGYVSFILLNFDYKIIAYCGIAFYIVLFIVLYNIYNTSIEKAFRKVRD